MAYRDENGVLRKSGGRQKGTKNKRTVAREERAQRAAAEMIRMRGDNGMFSGNSHEFLMSIYQDLAMPVELRADAAKAALRHEAPQGDQAPFLVITDKELEEIQFPEGNKRFVVKMPAPTPTLEEWKEKYVPTFKQTKPSAADGVQPLDNPNADEKD